MITVGADRPVYSCIFESLSATSTLRIEERSVTVPKKDSAICSFEYTRISYQRSKGIRRFPPNLGGILLVLLNVDTDGGTNRTSSREAEYLEYQ